jgi:hypothetical protein
MVEPLLPQEVMDWLYHQTLTMVVVVNQLLSKTHSLTSKPLAHTNSQKHNVDRQVLHLLDMYNKTHNYGNQKFRITL